MNEYIAAGEAQPHMIQPNRKAGSKKSGIRKRLIARPIQAPMISGSFDQMFGMFVLPGTLFIRFISMVSQGLMLREWTSRVAKLLKVAEAASAGNEVLQIAVYGRRKQVYTLLPA